jgi:hypothetical protein
VLDLQVSKHIKITVQHPQTRKTSVICTSSSPSDHRVFLEVRSYARKTFKALASAAAAALAATATLLATPTPASAANVFLDRLAVTSTTLVSGEQVIAYPVHIVGPIAQGDETKFLEVLGEVGLMRGNGPDPDAPAHIQFILNSPGGHVMTAIRIAGTLRTLNKVTTETRVAIEGECMSACSIIHLASAAPVGPTDVDSNRLCMHMAQLPDTWNGSGDNYVPNAAATKEMLLKMQAIGIPVNDSRLYKRLVAANGDFVCVNSFTAPTLGITNINWPSVSCDANGECND